MEPGRLHFLLVSGKLGLYQKTGGITILHHFLKGFYHSKRIMIEKLKKWR